MLHYKANCGLDFELLFAHFKHQPADGVNIQEVQQGSFVSSDFHSSLQKSQELIFILSDQNQLPLEVLSFRGVWSFYGWFQPENIISSSLWDIKQTTTFASFKLGYSGDEFVLEIVQERDQNGCDDLIFLKVVCHRNTVCENSKWLERQPVLGEKPCAILYSDWPNAVRVSQAKFAYSLDIKSVQVNMNKFRYSLVFRFGSFTQTDFASFYQGTASEDHSDPLFFRAVNFEQEMGNSRTFYVVFYSMKGTRNSHIFLDPDKKQTDMWNWFQADYQKGGSFRNMGGFFLWSLFDAQNPSYSLTIQRQYNAENASCEQRIGRVAVICDSNSIQNSKCEFEKWWKNEDNSIKCVIFDQKKETRPWSHSQYSVISRLEIYTAPIPKAFSYRGGLNVDFYQFYQSATRSLPENSADLDRNDFFAIYDFSRRLNWGEYIRLDIFGNDQTLPVQKLSFDCSKQGSDYCDFSWFGFEHLLETSSWNKSLLTSDAMMGLLYPPDVNYGRYLTWMWAETCQTDRVFLTVSCYPYCPSWEKSQCSILYSPHRTEPSLGASLALASKLEIFAPRLPDTKIDWFTVLSVNAFSGVNFHEYFQNGTIEAATDKTVVHLSGLFRSPILHEELSEARHTYIRLRIYDFEAINVSQDIIFDTNEISDAVEWLKPANLWQSPFLWSITKESSGEYFTVRHSASGDYLVMAENYDACQEQGWFAVVTTIPSYACSDQWRQWWLHDDVTSRSMSSQVQFQPPAFFFNPFAAPKSYSEMRLSGKITVEVGRLRNKA